MGLLFVPFFQFYRLFSRSEGLFLRTAPSAAGSDGLLPSFFYIEFRKNFNCGKLYFIPYEEISSRSDNFKTGLIL